MSPIRTRFPIRTRPPISTRSGAPVGSPARGFGRRLLAAAAAGALTLAALALGPAAPVTAAPGADTGLPPGEGSHRSGFEGSEGQSCFMYANEYGFGAYCPSAGGGIGERITIGEFLGVEEDRFWQLTPPFPECWHKDLPPNAQSGDLPPGEKRYVTNCIENYDDLHLQEDTPRDIEFSTSYANLPPHEVVTLTPEQDELIEAAWESSTFPPTFVEVRPEDAARVNSDTRFFMKVQDASEIRPGEVQYMDTIEVAGIQMRAYLHRLEVHPEGEGEGKPMVFCEGADIMASDAATRQSAPNSCWHTYTRSSASQPDNVYRAQGYAYWQVQFREGEGDDWKNFPEGTATQSEALVRRGGLTRVPVRDVQTLAVP